MWCAKLILIYYLGIVTCRPQDQPLTDTKNVDTDAGVESSNLRPSAWLPLAYSTLQGLDKKIIYHPSSSFQLYHFPRQFLQSNIKTEGELKEIIKNHHLPNNVLSNRDSKILKNNKHSQKIIIDNPQEEVKMDKILNGNVLKEILRAEIPATNKPPSLAPYRLHPLFHYIKNKNTILQNKIIRIRTSSPLKEGDITTLILKPQATAVAGVEGKAISNPLSRAILREGMDVDILFEPAAVAVAGPGGIAHAQSDLEISYETS